MLSTTKLSKTISCFFYGNERILRGGDRREQGSLNRGPIIVNGYTEEMLKRNSQKLFTGDNTAC